MGDDILTEVVALDGLSWLQWAEVGTGLLLLLAVGLAAYAKRVGPRG